MIKVLHKYGLLLSLATLFINAFSQEVEPDFSVKGTVHLGALLPHRQVVNEIVEGHTVAYELSFYKSTIGKKQWQQVYAYPKVGISALYHNLGNPNELGNAVGIFPFVELPLNQRKINWRLKLGYGLGYIQKPFDVETNYKNVAIGSHFNALIYVNMLWNVKLSNALDVSSGLSIIHYSNSSFAQPNLGINIFSLNSGVTYKFGDKPEKIISEIPVRDRAWEKHLMTGFGLKEIQPVKGPKYFVNTYSFNMLKPIKHKGSFGFGVDVFYNTSLSDLIAKDTTATTSGMDNFRSGIVGIYAFDFGDISLLIEMGGYIFSKYKGNGSVYNRVSSRYTIKEKYFINLGLKTHVAVADFVEVGFGIKL